MINKLNNSLLPLNSDSKFEDSYFNFKFLTSFNEKENTLDLIDVLSKQSKDNFKHEIKFLQDLKDKNLKSIENSKNAIEEIYGKLFGNFNYKFYY